MVGNDVVDLRDRESDPATLHPRFDARVFAAHELDALRGDGSPALRWRLWAAKEAAYKAVKKVHARAVFSPSRFAVEVGDAVAVERPSRDGGDGIWDAIVSCPEGRCDVRIEERDGIVHAVATLRRDTADGRSEELLHGTRRAAPDAVGLDPNAPGRLARAFAAERLAETLGLSREAIEIRKRGRIPELFIEGSRAPGDLSLSHHGAVVAFACRWRDGLPFRARA